MVKSARRWIMLWSINICPRKAITLKGATRGTHHTHTKWRVCCFYHMLYMQSGKIIFPLNFRQFNLRSSSHTHAPCFANTFVSFLLSFTHSYFHIFPLDFKLFSRNNKQWCSPESKNACDGISWPKSAARAN